MRLTLPFAYWVSVGGLEGQLKEHQPFGAPATVYPICWASNARSELSACYLRHEGPACSGYPRGRHRLGSKHVSAPCFAKGIRLPLSSPTCISCCFAPFFCTVRPPPHPTPSHPTPPHPTPPHTTPHHTTPHHPTPPHPTFHPPPTQPHPTPHPTPTPTPHTSHHPSHPFPRALRLYTNPEFDIKAKRLGQDPWS